MKGTNNFKSGMLCVLLWAFAACASQPKEATDNRVMSTTPTPESKAAITASANPLDDLTRTTRAMLDAKSYRARMESSFEGTNRTTMFEFAAPDRYHIDTGGFEMIILGAQTFQKPPGGRWQKFPVNMNEMISAFRDPKLLDEIRKSTDVKFLGPEVLDGTPMLTYQYKQDKAFGTNIKSDFKIWVSAVDGLPRRMEVEGEMNSKKTKTVITYSDFNGEVKIEPPM
jgi:hypothetical protein